MIIGMPGIKIGGGVVSPRSRVPEMPQARGDRIQRCAGVPEMNMERIEGVGLILIMRLTFCVLAYCNFVANSAGTTGGSFNREANSVSSLLA